MSTCYGNTERHRASYTSGARQFRVRCYDDRYVMVLELEAKNLNDAKRQGRAQRKDGYKKVLLRRVAGNRHGKPIEWRYNPQAGEWIETKHYDELANGKKAPATKVVPPTLFAEQV